MSRRSVPIILLGAGGIGRALLGQLTQQLQMLATTFDLAMPICLVASSRLWLCDDTGDGLADSTLSVVSRAGLTSATSVAYTSADLLTFLRQARPSVVVDVTASSEMVPVLLAALEAGHDIVLANKKPLADDDESFGRLLAYRRRGQEVRYETTVGAGLPVIRPLQESVQTGDTIVRIDAALSGTLGYLCSSLQDGVPFSTAVLTARSMGYTEPDPRDDLAGRDVARKAVILARTWGLTASLEQTAVDSLVPADLVDCAVDIFLARVGEADAEMAERVATARADDKVLRFVASITPDQLMVRLEAVALDHPLATLRGTDSLVAVTTERYPSPIVVRGTGAGGAVTAGGVFADILTCALGRRG